MAIREDILKQGFYQKRMKRAGMLQQIKFAVIEEDGIRYLSSEKFIDLPGLLEVANETGLPVKTKNGKIFPMGKSAEDYRQHKPKNPDAAVPETRNSIPETSN